MTTRYNGHSNRTEVDNRLRMEARRWLGVMMLDAGTVAAAVADQCPWTAGSVSADRSS